MVLLRLSTSILFAFLAVLACIWGALIFDIEMISAPLNEFMSGIADNIYTQLFEIPIQEASATEFGD